LPAIYLLDVILLARGERPIPQGRTDDAKKKLDSLFKI